jgi:hypothetical protein
MGAALKGVRRRREGIATVVFFFLSMAPKLLVGRGLLFVEVLTLHSLTLTICLSLCHTHTHTHTLVMIPLDE